MYLSYIFAEKRNCYSTTKRSKIATLKPLYNGHIGPCKTGPYNEVASLLR